jgi:N-acetylglutamate synthase-like GNAT family acetyltransferase
MKIREAKLSDINTIVKILKINNQFGFTEVDGSEAMQRVISCKAAVFLVYEINRKIVGIIRGVYDGSRALIHQLSVHPTYQKQGIGTSLVMHIISKFQQLGALTVSATITQRSALFWYRIGFKKTEAFLVGNW